MESGTEGLTLGYRNVSTSYDYNGIKVYSFGLLYQDVLYSGSGLIVLLNAETAEDKVATGVAASAGTLGGNAQSGYTLTMAAANSIVTATIEDKALNDLHLSDVSANTTTIEDEKGKYYNVTIDGRTLYKDGSWNTLCLPFDVSADKISVHPQLQGCTIMELDTDGWYDAGGTRYDEEADGRHQTGFDASDGTLYLYFQTANEIDARRPYIIKWDAATPNYFENPTFYSSYIESSSPGTVESADGKVQFKGNFDPVTLKANNKSNLYLGVKDGKNTLFWPSSDKQINAFRGYFHVDLDGGSVSAIQMYFGDDETTGIITMPDVRSKMSDVWYTLDGRKLDGKPTQKGIYIYNGKKIIK